MKTTLLAIAVAAGTMFAAPAPKTSAQADTNAPAKTTKVKKTHKSSKKHHKGDTTPAAPAAQK